MRKLATLLGISLLSAGCYLHPRSMYNESSSNQSSKTTERAPYFHSIRPYKSSTTRITESPKTPQKTNPYAPKEVREIKVKFK